MAYVTNGDGAVQEDAHVIHRCGCSQTLHPPQAQELVITDTSKDVHVILRLPNKTSMHASTEIFSLLLLGARNLHRSLLCSGTPTVILMFFSHRE